MIRIAILALPVALSACAGVPADWGFTDNDPRRALVPTSFENEGPPVVSNDGSGLFYAPAPARASEVVNDGCGLFYDDC